MIGTLLGLAGTGTDEGGPRTVAGLDWPGVATIVAGLALVTIAIDDVSVEGPTSLATLVPLVVGVVLLVTFWQVETRVTRPLVRPSLARNHLFVVLLVAGTFANIGTVVYILGATLDLQNVRGLSPAAAGLAFSVSSVGLALCGPLSGRLSVRYVLTILISVGGIGVVAATAVVEAIGSGKPTAGGVATTLYLVAGCLLLAGIITLAVEAQRLRRQAVSPP